MKPKLVGLLVCPVDKSELSLIGAANNGAEILTGTLVCQKGHQYPITYGIPRLLIPGAAQFHDQTQESFGSKWGRIPNFGHEEASRDIYVNWYLDRFGFEDIDGLRKFLASKKMVLDAGTGLGRDALLYGENSPAQVFALDLSDSVDLAYRHVGHLSNVHVLQADLTALPFPYETFDYLACDQVLHHTPNTAESFAHLAGHLAPGGEMAVYVYKSKGPIREYSDDFLRAHFTTAPEEECYEFSKAMALLGKALADLKIDLDVPEGIPILDIEAGPQNLQRFIYWNVFKCYWNENLDLETNIMTNFDWYRPKYAHRHTKEEVESWCSQAALEILRLDVIQSGISVRARRPEVQADVN